MFPVDASVILLAVAVAAIAMVLGVILGRRTEWPERRVVLVSSLAIPGVVIAFAVAILISSFTTSTEDCGVDACGMAAAGAAMLIMLALAAFAVSLVSAQAGYWLSKR
jgi:hypothetical protein